MPQEIFTYKRENHFRHWLMHLQGKENDNQVPQVVYDALERELEVGGIPRDQVDRRTIVQLLKTLHLARHYKNISKIHHRLTGQAPPVYFSQEEESQLILMFVDFSHVFDNIKLRRRHSFFSYERCLFEFCRIRGFQGQYSAALPKYLSPLGEDDNAVLEQCLHELGWEIEV